MRRPAELFSRSTEHPILPLCVCFILWKCLLIAVAVSSPGPGYDTSTTLIHGLHAGSQEYDFETICRSLSHKLTRWDAIYFVKVAERGYLFEQEWAWGYGWTSLLFYATSGLQRLPFLSQLNHLEAVAGIIIAHVSHGLAVLTLYALSKQLFPDQSYRAIPVLAGVLHILSPAGLFLSAPYGESTFALLSFVGYLLFVYSIRKQHITGDIVLVMAGIVFGISTTVRSNGILNGILFLEEAFRVCMTLRRPNLYHIRRLLAAGIAGLFVGAGFVIPQVVAYVQYCSDLSDRRAWCRRIFPSVYTFVQSHYWGVGFLNYWTVSNLPLFSIATPMLIVMLWSAYSIFRHSSHTSQAQTTEPLSPDTPRLLRSLAIPQIVLAAMAITNYHVQIINRLSSAYPVWYIWLASQLVASIPIDAKVAKHGRKTSQTWSVASLTRAMILYGLVQGGLFASFLPPA